MSKLDRETWSNIALAALDDARHAAWGIELFTIRATLGAQFSSRYAVERALEACVSQLKDAQTRLEGLMMADELEGLPKE